MPAKGQIVNFEEPETLEQGQKYYLRNEVKNVGDEPGIFRQRYVLLWEGTEYTSEPLELSPGESGSFVFMGFMPSQNATIDTYLERGPEWVQDDYHQTVIKLGSGQPHVAIEEIKYPTSQYPYNITEVTVTITNTGATSAYTVMRVLYHWTGEETKTKWIILDPGKKEYMKFTFIMPNQDATITISFLRLHDSDWVTDDSRTITIKLQTIPPPPYPPLGWPWTTILIPIIICAAGIFTAVAIKKLSKRK
jgi:subtilase family serine protease